jgi:hypothetical protein
MQSKQRIIEEAFPPGAKLVWSDKDNKLVLQVPTAQASHPRPAKPPQSASITIIDRVLAGAPKAVTS